VPSVYALKPAFQRLLRPIVRLLARIGVTASQVTLFACVLSVAVGCFLTFRLPSPRWLLTLPVFLFVRMALNAINEMLTLEFGQNSKLGADLTETRTLSDSVEF